MLFQVIDKSGVPVMRTEHKSCIPDDKRLSLMSKAGFKFKIDGKTASIKIIKDVRDSD